MSRRHARSAAGFTVAELLAALALGATLTAVSVPSIGAARQALAVRGAAARVAAGFRELSADARASQRSVGWQVRVAPLAFRVVEDGDGDGLRRDDVEQGIDLPLGEWVPVGTGATPVDAVVGCACPEADGSGQLVPGDRGLRFGASSFISFSPDGSASAGTVYLTAAGGPTVAVRVLGTTGRTRVFEYEPHAGAWAER